MAEESSRLLPPAEQSTEEETEPEAEHAESAPEPEADTSELNCECEEEWRSACEGEAFYKEHEGKRYCVLHYPGTDKISAFRAALKKKLDYDDYDFHGVWFPDEVDFGRFEFASPSYFSSATFSSRVDFNRTTFAAEADFSAAQFKADAYFIDAKFAADVHFSFTTFSAQAQFMSTTFSSVVHFINTKFVEAAYFNTAKFSADASFTFATFNKDVSFRTANFAADVYFNSVEFIGAVDFSLTTFDKRVDFESALFGDSVRFFLEPHTRPAHLKTDDEGRALGRSPSIDFQHAKMEKPERVSFHTVAVRPNWFVNVDPRNFVFTDVSWDWDVRSIGQEIASLSKGRMAFPHRLLAITCRQLAENAEANNRYEEASRFRYWAMDLARRTKWKGWPFWKTDWLHMLYWAVSGYGERIRNALGVLAAVWIVFVLLYTRVGFAQQPPKASNDGASSAPAASMTVPSITIEDRRGQPLEFSRALTYSLAVMSLQKPEPKPLTGTAQALVLLETILGPLQAALLALAIRRKFMR